MNETPTEQHRFHYKYWYWTTVSVQQYGQNKYNESENKVIFFRYLIGINVNLWLKPVFFSFVIHFKHKKSNKQRNDKKNK